MSTIEHTIDVRVPIRTAYNQWTQFESFPEFMEGVEVVKQLNDSTTHWAVEIAGVRREFDAEITEQVPDQRIAWRSLDRPQHAGLVTFEPVDGMNCRVTLHTEYDPEGFAENVADALQLIRRRVQGDLERFKVFIEARGGETGAWRGEIPGGHLPGSSGGYDVDEPVPPIPGDTLSPTPVDPDYQRPGGQLPAPGPGPVPGPGLDPRRDSF